MLFLSQRQGCASHKSTNTFFIFYFFLIHRRALLSANQRQCSSNRANAPRTCWAKLFWPRIYLRRTHSNYIREAKVCPIKSQLYSPNTPKYVREQNVHPIKNGLNTRVERISKWESAQNVNAGDFFFFFFFLQPPLPGIEPATLCGDLTTEPCPRFLVPLLSDLIPNYYLLIPITLTNI